MPQLMNPEREKQQQALEQAQQQQQDQQQAQDQALEQQGQQQQQGQEKQGQEKQGQGYQAVQKLLVSKGRPDAKDVAKILGQYPEEKGAIIGLLQQSPALGNSYVQEVVEAAKGWHLDAKGQTLSWGDAGVEGQDYFYASGKRQGAGWQLGDFKGTADKKGLEFQKGENWTGQVGKDGLHTEIKTGEDQKVVIDGNYKDKEATLKGDYVSGDNTLGMGLHGKDLEHFGADLHGSTKLGEGETLSGKITADKDGDKAVFGASGEYQDKDTKISGKGSFVSGQEHSASLEASQKLGEKESIAGGLSQTTKDGETTYGANAKYSNDGSSVGVQGKFTSGQDHSASLDGTKKLGEKETLSGGLSQTTKDGETTYGANAKYSNDGNSVGAQGKFTSGDKHSASVDGTVKVGEDKKLSGKVGETTTDGATTYDASARLSGKKGELGVGGSYTDADKWSLTADGKRKFGDDLTGTAKLSHSVLDGKSTEGIDLGLSTDKTNLGASGRFTDDQNYSLGFKGSHKFGDDASLSGTADFGKKDGESFQKFGLSGQVGKDELLFNGSASYEKLGSKNPNLTAQFDGTATLLDDRLYAQGFGKLDNMLDDPKFQVGGALTWTPKDKMALTLSGVVDQDGGFDTRLQFDVFKKKIDSAKDLSEDKKKAALSVFVGYKQGMDGSTLNDRFGAGKFGAEQGQVYAGIGFRF